MLAEVNGLRFLMGGSARKENTTHDSDSDVERTPAAPG